MLDQEVYNQRVKAFLRDMRAKGVDPETAAELLHQMGQTDKTAKRQGIAYKAWLENMSPVERVARATMPELYGAKR